MDRRLTWAFVAALGLTPLAACMPATPETQFSWGVNDHLSQTKHPAPRVAHTYAYDSGPVRSATLPKLRMAKTQSKGQPIVARSSSGSSLDFDWPGNGRVISSFGATSNGARNDGINIAMTRGAPIRAAASGTVTYSGDELKDYGNLLLIRHDDGYVTAYAHADRLLVQRGDVVSRGQVIAYAGQTGDVSSPQLHFEIRKGTAPVDPDTLLPASPKVSALTPLQVPG